MSDENNYDALEDTISNKKERRTKAEVRLNYDSDSLVEDFEQNKEDKHDNNDSDDDMFASDKEEEANSEKKAPKKDVVQLLDLNEFEKLEGIGQYDEALKEHVSGEQDIIDNEEEYREVVDYYTNIEDHEASVRIPKTDVKIEAFDLRDDAEEGDFDIDGNFIRREDDDKDTNQDHWIDDAKTIDVAKARKAHEKREQKQREQAPSATTPIEAILAQLIEVLEPSETPLEALARLRPPKNKRNARNKPKVDGLAETERKEAVLKMTDLCETLINSKGLSETYLLTREEFMRKYRTETGENYENQSRGTKRPYEEEDEEEASYGDKIWEFRWNDDDAINGPYSSYEMAHWAKTHFDASVTVRKVGEESFRALAQADFSE